MSRRVVKDTGGVLSDGRIVGVKYLKIFRVAFTWLLPVVWLAACTQAQAAQPPATRIALCEHMWELHVAVYQNDPNTPSSLRKALEA